MHKILVVTLSNLGDVILTLPVFQCLAEAFPNARMDVVTGPAAKEVFDGDPRLNRVIVFDKRMPWREKCRFILEVRRQRYDLIVDLRHSPIGYFGGARFRNSYLAFSPRAEHRVTKHLGALRGIVADALRCSIRGSWVRLGEGSSPAARPGAGRRLVVAAVGSKSDIKKWPAASYAKLLDKLAQNDGCRIALVGDANDRGAAEDVGKLMRSDVEDLSGRTDFKGLCSVLSAASLLITNDSAPLHLADSLGVPVLALFGSTDPRKYGPRLGASRVVSRRTFCSPCEAAQCRWDHECMKELGVEEVYRQALRMLGGEEGAPAELKILAVRLDRIGDVVLSLPALAAIKECFPHARLSVMVRPFTKEIVEGHPLVDEVIPYAYEKGGRHRSLVGNLRFIREIRKRRFDIAFILHPSRRSVLVPFLARIRYRIGVDRDAGPRWISSFLLTHRIPDRRYEGAKHESEYAMDVVRAFPRRLFRPAVQEDSSARVRVSLPVFPEEEAALSERLGLLSGAEAGRWIAFHPGASCPSKRWPLERFAALGSRIPPSWRIAVVGGEEDGAAGAWFQTAVSAGGKNTPRVVDLTGRLGLRELGVFLKRCDLLVSNDSGPVHIAAAVGTPTLVIFGRNQAGLSAARWKPLGEGHRFLRKDVGCAVCLAHRCTIDFECLKALEVEEVFGAVREMLSLEEDP